MRGKLGWSLGALVVVLWHGGSAKPALAIDDKVGAVLDTPVVFVSRQIPPLGSVYYPSGGSLPGVQPFSRFQPAAPGRLLVREANGSIRTLIDGASPTAATFDLIDVSAPAVSYDGSRIVFAGLPDGDYGAAHPVGRPNGWRIFVIGADGSGLGQLTFSDRDGLDYSQFGIYETALRGHDDTDPVWLPDGSIAFASTRYPSFGQYGGARTSNLYRMAADGSGLRRITTERNAAERPLVDPLTGRLVYSRWWRNFRQPTDDLTTVVDPLGGYVQHLGLLAAGESGVAGPSGPTGRNAWHLATIRPDGTDLRMFASGSSTRFAGEDDNHAYGGSFANDGSMYVNFFPMQNGTEAAGFGGIRHVERGASEARWTAVAGITQRFPRPAPYVSEDPISFGVFVSDYATDPVELVNGDLLIAWAPDEGQDYGLYRIAADGSNRRLVYDLAGTSEIRPQLLAPRSLPPVIADQVAHTPSPLPPSAGGPYDQDGTFVFDALNVLFNAPVDVPVINAPAIGTTASIRYFIDHQRDQQSGSFERLDWPILLAEEPISASGRVTRVLPADVPLFEQLRTALPDYRVPATDRLVNGAMMAHVEGMNSARPGTVVQCVGCHSGHTLIEVPEDPAAAAWTNLAPGATLTVSSNGPFSTGSELHDRRARTEPAAQHWRSAAGQPAVGQWIELQFPRQIAVDRVRPWGVVHGPGLDTVIESLRVELLGQSGQVVATATSGEVSERGSEVRFDFIAAHGVRLTILAVSGQWDGAEVATLAEVEVVASADPLAPPPSLFSDGFESGTAGAWSGVVN